MLVPRGGINRLTSGRNSPGETRAPRRHLIPKILGLPPGPVLRNQPVWLHSFGPSTFAMAPLHSGNIGRTFACDRRLDFPIRLGPESPICPTKITSVELRSQGVRGQLIEAALGIRTANSDYLVVEIEAVVGGPE